MLAQISTKADVLVLCGDLTDFGLPEEAAAARQGPLRRENSTVGVLGNHDYEGGKSEEIKKGCRTPASSSWTATPREVHGVGFAGVKGFAGGFGRGTLGPWGEDAVRIRTRSRERSVETGNRARASANASQNRRTARIRPVRATCEGEPPEIVPWLEHEPAGGTNRPVWRRRGFPRSCPQWPAGGDDGAEHARYTMCRCRSCAGSPPTSRSAP